MNRVKKSLVLLLAIALSSQQLAATPAQEFARAVAENVVANQSSNGWLAGTSTMSSIALGLAALCCCCYCCGGCDLGEHTEWDPKRDKRR